MRTSAPAVTCRMAWFSHRTWSRYPMAALLLGVVALAASCGGSPSASGSHNDHPTTTTGNDQVAAVLTAYRAEQQAFEQAFLTANASLPALSQTMVDPQLQLVERNLLGEQHDGMVGKGNVVLHPHVISITRNQAIVEDCLYSTQELVYASTGKPVPPVTPPEHDGVRSTLAQESKGIWKVSQQTVTEGHCPAGY
jgi:hypothetical protein